MTRKLKYIIGMIWWQFRKKKVKRELFKRIRFVDKHSGEKITESILGNYKPRKILFNVL